MSISIVLSRFFSSILEIAKKTLLPLAVLHFPFALLEQYVFASSTDDTKRVTFGVVAIIAALVESFLSFLLISYSFFPREKSFINFVNQNISSLIIETFRGMLFVILGFLKFIIPGFKRLVGYVFIPYIVIFDPSYAEGHVDVLNKTAIITRGKILKLLFILFLTQMVIFGIDFTGLGYNVFTSPEIWILIFFLEVVISICSFNLIYNIYLNINEQINHK